MKQFFTPSQLARILREESPCKHGHTIVDLAAGHGDLVHPFANSFSDHILVDIDEEAYSILKKNFPNASHLLGDSTDQEFITKIKNLNKKIDLSVCNPPFNYRNR
ncbi:methyltransferase [Modicisalibacter xianhensis]|uniref:methyltransferase n=1 Tax=Modicisalibacter xianhensis TaxID=442341 RepID=UPI0015A5ABAA|nr:methyltransferase [Halomonas xianhensis]